MTQWIASYAISIIRPGCCAMTHWIAWCSIFLRFRPGCCTTTLLCNVISMTHCTAPCPDHWFTCCGITIGEYAKRCAARTVLFWISPKGGSFMIVHMYSSDIYLLLRVLSQNLPLFRWFIGFIGGTNNFCLQKSRMPTGRIGIFSL